jgi:hypothetical protein
MEKKISSLFGVLAFGCVSKGALSQPPPVISNLIGTIWTWTIANLEFHEDPQDLQFIENGILITLKDGMRNNSWIQNGNSVTIIINDEYATAEFQIIDSTLMRGEVTNNNRGLTWKSELRKK